MKSNPKNNLNSAQSEAVNHPGGPLLVLAGAGSGKTRIITERIAHLIDIEKVRPFNILAVTFTNKAASEMKERINKLIPGQINNLWIGTFHSICLRILKRELHNLEGYNQDFVIYDPGDQIKVIKKCLAELNLSEKLFAPKSIRTFIDSAKNKGLAPVDAVPSAYDRKVLDVYEAYEAEMRKSNALDFGDLLNITVRLFSEKKEIAEKYQSQFQHILVDEYQDTNHIQYTLIEMLSRKHSNLFVVGDDNQSIYGWRGADIRNILDFQNDYAPARIIKLEENYRSTKTILEAANKLIQKNSKRHEKNLWTSNGSGEPVSYYLARDEKDEAAHVVSRVRSLKAESGFSYKDIAVFYRTNNQSRVVEEELLRKSVPYTIVGGTGFYERTEIKDVLAYLKVIANPLDEISLKRIINVPARGIGDVTVNKIGEIAAVESTSLFEAAKIAVRDELLPNGPLKRIKNFCNLIIGLRHYAKEHEIGKLLDYVLQKSGYLDILEKEEERRENVGEILNLAAEFEKTEEENYLQDFLDWIALVSDVDRYNDKSDQIALMTLHSAKGLEFPVVFIIGLEEDLLPHINSTRNGEVEEERRLFYVGLTRAKQRVILSSATRRRIFGSEHSPMPSRFIEDLPQEVLRCETYERGYGRSSIGRRSKKSPSKLRTSKPPSSSGKYRVGQRVQHPKFGEGIIKSVEGSGKDAKVSVLFPGYGIKKIIASFLSD